MAAKYRLTERAFIKPDDHLEASLHEAGAVIVYSGTPGRTFEALNAEAEAAIAQFKPLSVAQKNILPRRGDVPNPNLPFTSEPKFSGTNK